jgi:ankyrin repeat protein
MAATKRITLIFLILLVLSPSGKAQPDSLLIDSLAARIRVILDRYNEKTVFVDTSDYVTYTANWYDADNINLQIASSKGACNEILRLYARGADVNNYIGNIATPLHYAVASGYKDAVEILLLLGALPDKYDQYGITPLISAVRSDNLEIAELLIRYGASINKSDRYLSTPLHHAAALGFFYMTDMLLYYDAPVEQSDIEGNTPLMVGVGFGYYDIADILLQAGADPNAYDKKGFTPLMAAAQNGDTLMLRMLINEGANLYSVNKDKYDALGCAVRYGQTDAVAFMLRNGKRWNYRNNGIKNPVAIAEYYGQSKLLPLLNQEGMTEQRSFALEEFTFSTGGMFTSHYLLLDGAVSLTEPRIKAGVTLGAALNPFRWKLLVDDGNTIYQYRVNTSLIYAGIFKEFGLYERADGNKLSAVPSLSAGYRFYSDYEGVRLRPENSFCIIPSADLKWNIRTIGITAGISYLDTPFLKVSPLWLRLKVSYSILQKSPLVTGKKIKIYNYEK